MSIIITGNSTINYNKNNPVIVTQTIATMHIIEQKTNKKKIKKFEKNY